MAGREQVGMIFIAAHDPHRQPPQVRVAAVLDPGIAIARESFRRHAGGFDPPRHAGEARRSLTKFLSTITIAVFLEAIVLIFDAAKDGGPRMIYPVLLLLGGVALVVGFGVYLRLSAAAEQELGGAKGEARDEAEYQAAQDDAGKPGAGS